MGEHCIRNLRVSGQLSFSRNGQRGPIDVQLERLFDWNAGPRRGSQQVRNVPLPVRLLSPMTLGRLMQDVADSGVQCLEEGPQQGLPWPGFAPAL